MKMKKSNIILIIVALLFLINNTSTYFLRWIALERAKAEMSRQPTGGEVNE